MPATQSATASYLDPQTLAGVASLDLRARMIVEGLMTGMHRSPYHGFSVEFAQHRQYAPGDDLRHLDWKVFARTDKLQLKQYQQETNLDLLLLIDISGSMGYASDTKTNWRKYDHAASIAAAMSHLAIKQRDRVGLIFFTDEEREFVRPSSSRDHWRLIVDALTRFSPPAQQDITPASTTRSATNLRRLFDQVSAQITQRSFVVVISDLFDDPQAIEHGLARLSFRRHDVVTLQTLDHAELTFPFRSPAEFRGLEGEGRLRLDPAALRKAYLASLRAHLDAVEQISRRFRFDHLLLDTSQSLGPPLSALLARRAAFAAKGRGR